MVEGLTTVESMSKSAPKGNWSTDDSQILEGPTKSELSCTSEHIT